MQMPPDSSGSDVLLESYGVHHLAALGADPTAADIKTAFQDRQDALEAAQAGAKGAAAAATAANALALQAEVQVEGVIRKIESRGLEAVKKQRASEPYATLFPKNLEGALAPVGREQVTEANRIANAIAPSRTTRLVGVTDDIVGLVEELRSKTGALATQLDSVEAAETAATLAFGSELTARRMWREQYRKDHGLLTARNPNDKRHVETFFKPGKKSKPSGKGGAANATTGSGATAKTAG